MKRWARILASSVSLHGLLHASGCIERQEHDDHDQVALRGESMLIWIKQVELLCNTKAGQACSSPGIVLWHAAPGRVDSELSGAAHFAVQ